jgi:hypothetical protein
MFAGLKLLMQFHVLAGKGQLGGGAGETGHRAGAGAGTAGMTLASAGAGFVFAGRIRKIAGGDFSDAGVRASRRGEP